MMKNSLAGATAVLKGFAGWIYGRREEGISDVSAPPDTSEVVWACGRRAPTGDGEFADHREFAVRPDRWSPGLSLDNFS
jgi:hypothetical protein